MDQPVRVGLVFPRSGQQVFVYVPVAVAERVGAQTPEHRARGAELPGDAREGRNGVKTLPTT